MSNQEPPQKSEANPASVYVSNLDNSCSNKKIQSDLHQIFSKFGTISSIRVNRNLKFKRLFAFVVFADPKSAEEAVQNLNNTYFGDTRIKVQMQKGPRAQRNSNAVTCYRCQKVGHFAKDCTEPAQRRERRRRSRSPNNKKEKDNERSHKKRGRSRERKKRYSSSQSSSESSSSQNKRKMVARSGRERSRSRSRSDSSSSSSSSR